MSALLLFVPTISLAVLVTRPETPYWLMALAAAPPGSAGGNFASSMANISFFYPDREKGFALGLNAAGGNIGVSTVQLLVPLIIGWSWVNLGIARAERRASTSRTRGSCGCRSSPRRVRRVRVT